jgi:hypothetical protein
MDGLDDFLGAVRGSVEAVRRNADRANILAAARRQGSARRSAERRADTNLDAARRQGAARSAAERGARTQLANTVRVGQERDAARTARDVARRRGLALGAGRRAAQRELAVTSRGFGKLMKLAKNLKVGNKKLRTALWYGVPGAAIVAGGAGFAGGYVKGKKDAPTKVIRPPFEDIPRPGVNAPSFRGADTSGIVSGGSAPSSGGGQSYRGGQSSMTDTMKRNQRAVRDTESYLGEAFDATVQKGVQTGRKHLAAMLQRDGVDNETGTRIMKKYENSIAGQESLKGYNTRGLTEEFDSENPNKKGALLEAYRGKYAKGTTLQQMREKASASR